MPLFRQRQQRFRKKENLLDPNGQLIGLGSKQVPAHANRISQVQQMKQLESLFADNVFLYIDLNALARPLQVRKTRFPHQPEGHDAASEIPGDTDRAPAPGSVQVSSGAVQVGRAARIASRKSFLRQWRPKYSGARGD